MCIYNSRLRSILQTPIERVFKKGHFRIYKNPTVSNDKEMGKNGLFFRYLPLIVVQLTACFPLIFDFVNNRLVKLRLKLIDICEIGSKFSKRETIRT